MVLSIFSYVYLPSIYVLWWAVKLNVFILITSFFVVCIEFFIGTIMSVNKDRFTLKKVDGNTNEDLSTWNCNDNEQGGGEMIYLKLWKSGQYEESTWYESRTRDLSLLSRVMQITNFKNCYLQRMELIAGIGKSRNGLFLWDPLCHLIYYLVHAFCW